MKPYQDSAIRRIVELLNGDILREFQTADACMRKATCLSGKDYPVVRRQIAVCAAAALKNATALAAEVLALGGVPIIPRHPIRHWLPASRTIALYPGTVRRMLTHYRRRFRMADRLGLLRLREVFGEIVASKEQHLAHNGLIQIHD
ncbi:MAG TPA: hypothetical protein VLY24_17625 [Bryobacteraceae bacterium]|nr:hypothetical protein [Bryobacteraceae bacterium]